MEASPHSIMLDDELEREAARVLAGIGMTVDEAVNRLLAQVVHDQCLPFSMHVPNEETIQAMEEVERGEGRQYSSVAEMFADMRS